ncbi:MAG: hypothetical protein ACYC97_12400 [Metallibacterium sp.]
MGGGGVNTSADYYKRKGVDEFKESNEYLQLVKDARIKDISLMTNICEAQNDEELISFLNKKGYELINIEGLKFFFLKKSLVIVIHKVEEIKIEDIINTTEDDEIINFMKKQGFTHICTDCGEFYFKRHDKTLILK